MDVSITAALILKNEERCIKRCLDSISNVFDEIVIVDTGSTDKTLKLIEGFNGVKIKLFNLVWRGSFSDARNFAISKSTSEYVFFIDGDEYLSTSRQGILEELNKKKPSKLSTPFAYCPIIKNHDGNELKNIQRIFFNNGSLFYFGHVHEELRYKSKKEVISIAVNILVYHDGYMNDVVCAKKKIERNNAMNKKNIEIEPENMRWKYFSIRDNFFKYDAYHIISEIFNILKIDKDKDFPCDNMNFGKYTFAMLDLLAKAQLVTLESEIQFKTVLEAMNKLIPNNSNSLYYELMYDIFIFKRLAKKRVRQIIDVKNEHQLNHDGMIHSEGLHIDTALSIYLKEIGLINESEKLMQEVLSCRFPLN